MTQTETIIFGGGCFWCTEAVFQQLRGVNRVTSGYAGGTTPNPSYERLISGWADHAEVVRVEFDPEIISLEIVLTVFFASHDPTTLNRQGNDVGPAYRSLILTTTEQQEHAAKVMIEKLEAEHVFHDPIVTEVRPAGEFTEAEAYHQDFYKKNPQQRYCQVIIDPKIAKLRQTFAHLLR